MGAGGGGTEMRFSERAREVRERKIWVMAVRSDKVES